MAETVIMPKQGNTVEECVLVSWCVKEGDEVQVGQVIAEVETDKATFDLEAPVAGHLLALLCNYETMIYIANNNRIRKII